MYFIRKYHTLDTFAIAAIIVMSSCSSIDDNLDDCFIDMEAEYELHLVTNEEAELARTLGERPGIAAALRNHLSSIFSDHGNDLSLAFYSTDSEASLRLQRTETMNGPTKNVRSLLDIMDYYHLSAANIQNNGVIALKNNDSFTQGRLVITSQASGQQDAIASQATGVYTGRHSFINMKEGKYTYRLPLYMANSAAALVLDPRTASFTSVSIFTTGFATSFSMADSTYHYDNSPLVRTESVAMPDTTRYIAFCGVSFPSREPSHFTRTNHFKAQGPSTRLCQDTDSPFLYEDCGEDLWQYECYVTMTDGSITKTTIYIHHPLRAGQLKILCGHIDDEGVVRIYDSNASVSVDLDWKSGAEFNPVI